MMAKRICIFGAGAVGGVLAGKLSAAGHDVSVVARGAHLESIRADGLRVFTGDEVARHRVRVSESGADLGAQDLIISAVKAHALSTAAEALGALGGNEAPILFILNGVPWWYPYKAGGTLDSSRLASIDPHGRIWRTIGPQRALGSVIYTKASMPSPGVVRYQGAARLIVGEPDNTLSPRLVEALDMLKVEGIAAEATDSIRVAVFGKLLNTISLNQVCALTGSQINEIVADAATRELVRALMEECASVGRAIGAPIDVDIDARIAANADVAFKPSTLQDLEAGKPLEIDALVAAVSELGRAAKVATPLTDAVYALMHRIAVKRGLYQGA
jgi:2-dehydropantoate 2-reductase